MARLPIPHKDTNVWGDILNDFLRIEHDEEGRLLLRTDGTFDAKENTANKSTNTNLGTSNVLYPSQRAVKEYVDAHTSSLDEALVIAYATIL